MQRFFTRSRFDHVALIIKNENNAIIILEATANKGVSGYLWTTFVKKKVYNEYEQIVYRRLIHNNTLKISKKFIDFSNVSLYSYIVEGDG